jgi:hypothetical protein
VAAPAGEHPWEKIGIGHSPERHGSVPDRIITQRCFRADERRPGCASEFTALLKTDIEQLRLTSHRLNPLG